MAEFVRDLSRRDWTGSNTREDIQLGCMQRIADATEVMAKRHTELMNERDQARRDAAFWQRIASERARSNRSFKGQITKLRNRLAQACMPKEDSHE